MSRPAYYNEFHPYNVAWLRRLIDAGLIAPGHVDDRSIEDVRPSDLDGFGQCHFFAGIGVWSYAARRAGIPDSYPLWTGSCPCQPFSAAGAGNGFADERHLWPAFHHLVAQRRPVAVAGEQVGNKDAAPWIDLVRDDVEALGYAFGAAAFPSAGVGAPHIRDRAYWVASRRGLADADREGLEGRAALSERAAEFFAWANGMAGRLADAEGSGRRKERAHSSGGAVGNGAAREPSGFEHGGAPDRPGPVNGFWRAADWLGCTDGRWRPVEPGTSPLAHGIAGRMGRLHAYGNAINAEAALTFLQSVVELGLL